MTLIETGLVVALFGVLAIYLTESHLAEWYAWEQSRKVDGAVSDVWGIIDAARAWSEQNAGVWPNDGVTPTASIQLTQLVEDGYLRIFPESRDYAECNQCGEYYGGGARPSCCYAMTGWDYSASAETTDPDDADDLIVRFSVWGKYAADAIAAQVPFGKVSTVSGEEYRVEARAPMKGRVQCVRAPRSSYVRVCGEDRAVKMSRGDLQGVHQIAGELQAEGELQGAGLALRPAELSSGAFGAPSEPQAQLLLRKDSDDAVNTLAAFGLDNGEGDLHLMKFGVIASCVVPYFSLSGYENAEGFDHIEVDAGFLFARQKSGPSAYHPPFWEMFLARRSTTLRHRGLQDRLCALEAEVQGVSPDCTCPATTATTCASS